MKKSPKIHNNHDENELNQIYKNLKKKIFIPANRYPIFDFDIFICLIIIFLFFDKSLIWVETIGSSYFGGNTL